MILHYLGSVPHKAKKKKEYKLLLSCLSNHKVWFIMMYFSICKIITALILRYNNMLVVVISGNIKLGL